MVDSGADNVAGTGFIDSWEKVDPKTGKKADGSSPKKKAESKAPPKKNFVLPSRPAGFSD